MELLFCIFLFGCLVMLLQKGNPKNQLVNRQSTGPARNGNMDDFAGLTIGSLFLLDEFIDRQDSGIHSAEPNLLEQEQVSIIAFDELDWCEDEFLD